MKSLLFLISALTLAVPLADEARAQPQGKSASEQAAAAREGTDVAKRVFASSDSAAAYKNLSKADRQKFLGVMTPGDFEPIQEKIVNEPSASGKSFNGCWALHATGGRKAFFGNTLYTYWQSTRVCARNGRVTMVNVYDAGGETSTPGWHIKHPPTLTRRNVGWEGRGKAEYHFVLSGPWDIQSPTDCIQLRLNADGRHYRVMNSCDLGAR